MRKATLAAVLMVLSLMGSLVAGADTAVSAAPNGQTLKVLVGTYPDSVDPDLGFTTQSEEADVAVYTPLLTYAQKSGVAGTRIIPGLASALPTVSADGLTYRLTLRRGLKYSDGAPVVASDFTYGVERAIQLKWGGEAFYTSYIAGAAGYASGKAKTIKGITTNDGTGAVTIHLSQPFGAFDDVLAFPGAAPIPTTTPMTPEPVHPPAGVGPYEFSTVVPNVSYTLVRNPRFASLHLPGLATGSVSKVEVTLESNNTIEAEDVIGNQADIFDPADTLPPQELSAAKDLPRSRYSNVVQAETNFIFFDVRTAPFDHLAARQAVDLALDRGALSRLAGGFSVPTCYFIPPSLPGHVDGDCPAGASAAAAPSAATVARAKALIQKAGLAGTRVTVWSQTKQPQQAYMVYYTDLLDQLGFKATLKVVADAAYFQIVGNARTAPQTGFLAWNQDFPDPSDFYALLSAQSIHPENSLNVGHVDDPHIQAVLKELSPVPSAKLPTVAGQWQALDRYVSREAYIAPFGNLTLPLLYSDRVVSATFNPVDYLIYATVKLN